MKIAILGNIIETTTIYKITKLDKILHNKNNYYGFEIHHFNDREPIIISENNFENHEYSNIFVFVSKQDERIQKLTDLRENIVKIWLENQTEIPQFNLE